MIRALWIFLFALTTLHAQSDVPYYPGSNGSKPTGPAGGVLGDNYPNPSLSAATQANITSRNTYVLEDYLSTADGHSGLDYGYAATNFCATVGCSTLTAPVALKTTSAGICRVYTSLTIPAPIHFDATSCTLVPQSTMGSSYISLSGCSTTIGSTTVSCASTTGLLAGMAIGGGTLGPENYVFSVTNSTTFVLALPASRVFLALLTSGSTATGPINGSIAEAANGQTVTGPGVLASTTITVVPATNSFTLSNAATIGTTSPVDLALAPGTVVSGLTLSAITVTPVIIVPASANLSTTQSKPHGPNYGVALSNVTIQDPAYSHSNFGRSIFGVSGIQIYGQDNAQLHSIQIGGLDGSAVVYGGVTPSVPTGAVRESDAYDVYAYSTGDVTTGQACLALMTGYGQGVAGQDEINQDGFHNVHCVYSDAEGLTIGTYLHPGTTNGPRLLTFDGDNQFEAGTNAAFSFSSTDMVRILSAGSHNQFLGGEWTTPGFGKSVFHVSQGIDLSLSGVTIGGSGGSPQTFNVSLTHNSTTVGYVSAGTGAGTSFMVGPYWNGIGAVLTDAGSCTTGCNVWLATSSAVNGSGTTLTLNTAYAGTQTTGTLLVQPGGSYFHLDQSNALTSPLKLTGGTYVDAPAAIQSLLGVSSALNNFTVGTGAMLTPPPSVNDYNTGAPSVWQLNLLPTGYTANSASGGINFQTSWLNSAGIYQQGRVTATVSNGSGVNPSHFLYYTCTVCNGDFYNNIQNNTSGAGAYMNLNSTGGNHAAFGVVGNTQNWSMGLLGNTLLSIQDNTNSKAAITITPSTEAVAFGGPVTAPNLPATGPFFGIDSGSSTAYVITSTQTASLQNGTQVCFVPGNNNGSSVPTLNWNGTGVHTITQLTTAVLTGTGIQTSAVACVIYQGTDWVLQNSNQPSSFYGRGVLFPSSAATGCVVNASSSSAYQCTSTSVGITSNLPGLLYSTAGTPLPTCNTAAKGLHATVSDALTPTYGVAYTGGGTIVSSVLCSGTAWTTQ